MSTYQYLDNLIYCYFNQDSDLDGDTIDELVAEFKSTNTEEQIKQLINDIRGFMSDTAGSTEQVFGEKYGFDVDPSLWDHTARTFLEEILRLLK